MSYNALAESIPDGRSLYPEYIGQEGGGLYSADLRDELNRHFRDTDDCGKFWHFGIVNGSVNPDFDRGDWLMKRCSCKDKLCVRCGAQDGVNHRGRQSDVLHHLDRIGGVDKLSLREFIFTVPESQREFMMKRSRINSFRRICVSIVRKQFGCRRMIGYVHLVGEDGKTFKPHVIVHAVESRGTEMFIPSWMFDRIKDSMRKALVGLGCVFADGDVMNFRYRFKAVTGKIIHAIRYNTRPLPNAESYLNMVNRGEPGDVKMLEFLLVKMKGFQFVAYPSREWKDVEVVENSMPDLIEGVSVLWNMTPYKLSAAEFEVFHTSGFGIDRFEGRYIRRELRDGLFHYRRLPGPGV